jgi:hypothetical protein
MKKILIIFSLITVASILILREGRQKRPSEPLTEGCVFCHSRVNNPDPSHRVSAFGCYVCHLGNSYSIDKKRAHFAMVKNPGDLRVADRTCGKAGCHSEIVRRVQNSIMATNSGIIKTVQDHWRASTDQLLTKGVEQTPVGVRDLMGENPPENLAIELYRKMCGGCHLWKQRGGRLGEIGRRGGGCSDCHVLDTDKIGSGDIDIALHPIMTTRIPSENCIKCHNRSARVGLSYFGRFESAGYGTPYEGRRLNSRRLSGDRFFLHLRPDIHCVKADMECIDCHTATGLMGDGRRYNKMQDQVDITCQACHLPYFSRETNSESLGSRLIFLNKKVPECQDESIAFSRKGTPLYNLQKRDNKILFFRKRDGHAIEMDITSGGKPHHRLPGHMRLSCQACHSTWMPQCYGCHLTYRRSDHQRDWLTGKESRGRWNETRSYLRFSIPALGLKNASTVFPISPCQVFASILDEQDRVESRGLFKVFSLSALDPHTTSGRSRGCLECHGNPKALGMGEGLLQYRDGKWFFRPTYDSVASALDITLPLDGFVGVDGEPLPANSVEGVKPFSKQEIDRIFSVNACLGCHNQYSDKIYQDFPEAKRRFETETGLPCQK